jgi:HSP20 family protein
MADKSKKRDIERVTPSRAVSPLEEMERWLDESFPRAWMHRFGWPSWGELTRPIERFAPRVNVLDRDDEIVVRAEVPGVEKDDLEVSVTESSVSIKGSKKHEEKEEKGDYYRCEIATGTFARTITLPSAIDSEKVEASFKDGVLELKLPKVSKAKRRTIKLD